MPAAQELGQALFAENTQEFEVPLFAQSLLRGIKHRLAIAYWNVTQKQFEQYGQYTNLDFGLLRWRPDTPTDRGANLWLESNLFFGLKISWYKNFGRSMTCSQHLSANEWIAWHDLAIAEIDRVEKDWSDGRTRNYLT